MSWALRDHVHGCNRRQNDINITVITVRETRVLKGEKRGNSFTGLENREDFKQKVEF